MSQALIEQEASAAIQQAKRFGDFYFGVFCTAIFADLVLVLLATRYNVSGFQEAGASMLGGLALLIAGCIAFRACLGWDDRKFDLEEFQANDPQYLLEATRRSPRFMVTSTPHPDRGSVEIQLLEGSEVSEAREFAGADIAVIESACEYQSTLITRAEELNEQHQDVILQEHLDRSQRQQEAAELHEILQAAR
jgi:hypothetical protein